MGTVAGLREGLAGVAQVLGRAVPGRCPRRGMAVADPAPKAATSAAGSSGSPSQMAHRWALPWNGEVIAKIRQRSAGGVGVD